MKKSIIWLASYPKSGNTWVRIFLANYLFNTKTPVSINQVHRLGLGDAIARLYEKVAPGPFDRHNPAEVLPLRDAVLRGIVGNDADVNFVKTHCIRRIIEGYDMFPEKFTRASIYIVRNPLDMVLSYARHHGQTVEDAVISIGHPDNATIGHGDAVVTPMSSWSEHVNAWVGWAPWPQVVIRYEDMLTHPEREFTKILEIVGVPVEQERLQRAIRNSSFKEVKAQEEAHGFVERPGESDSFFASGTSGIWKEALPEALAEQVLRDHRPTMKRFGYLKS